VLRAALEARFGNHHRIGDIRGRGLFLGLELVRDRASKAPPDPAAGLPARIKREAMAQGLICYPGGGTIDGKQGVHVLLAPPFIIGEAQVDEIVDKLGAALEAALDEAALAGRA
jgi:adenosylmethionine-8-amino-7-oxononanoate aminotransferase